MLRFIVQCHELDRSCGFERRGFLTIEASVPDLERLLRRGGRDEMSFESWQLVGVELGEVDPALDVLPYWAPCNPGCDPELNGKRSRLCICEQARAAFAVEKGA